MKNTIKSDVNKQFAHTWRVFESLVREFDANGWLHTGRGSITPARLSLHLLQSVKYYLEDPATILFNSGKALDADWETLNEKELPSQSDIVACINTFKEKTELWLSEMDFEAENTSFDWTGNTKFGIALFSLRHLLYHLGELSSLLNESRNGDVDDIYVKA